MVYSGLYGGGAHVKASVFNVVTHSYFPSMTLLFNTLSGALRTMSPDEEELILEALSSPCAGEELTESLRAEGFVVGDDHDERATMRADYSRRRSQPPGDLALTISATVSCNFRCGYCFEEHPNRSFQDVDIEAIRAFVDKRLGEGRQLGITWFGGEPLMAFGRIKDTYEAVKEVCTAKGASYSHSIITNGLLLTQRKVEWLRDKGIGMVQVTIDGDRASHDRRRPDVAGGGTYDRILDNITAAATQLPISIRINVDRTNCDSLLPLVEEFRDRGLQDHLNLYLGHTEQYTDECGELDGQTLSNEEFAALELEFRLLLINAGFKHAWPGKPKARMGALCVADNPAGYVISPRGVVVGCWNEAALSPEKAPARLLSDGTLSSSNQSGRSWTKWKDYDPFRHSECATCRVQPLCKGGCPRLSDEKPTEGPGACSTLRWNLEEHLRLYHLRKSYTQRDEDAAVTPCQ